MRVYVRVCMEGRGGGAVIAREEPCARRTLKLIKEEDRVIIHHGPLERLMLKSLLLINSETVLRINNNIKEGTERRSANTSGPGSSFLITIKWTLWHNSDMAMSFTPPPPSIYHGDGFVFIVAASASQDVSKGRKRDTD